MSDQTPASNKPRYPLTVIFADGEIETVDDEEEARCNLEWLDTDDVEEPVVVTDELGRRVRLKIANLQIEICELQK